MRLRTLSLSSLALAFGTVSAFATPIPLSPVTTASYGTLVAGSTVSGSGTAPSGAGVPSPFSVSYSESAYRGGTGSLCPTCINFVYTFSDTASAGANSIERFNTTSFAGFSFTAGYVAGSGVVPSDASYSSGNGTISFNFDTTAVTPGTSSDTLVIFTNATNFIPGTLSFQDGTTFNGNGLMPSNAAPEPSSLALLGTGILGVAGAARRRFKK